MGYFNPQSTIDKIKKETGISNEVMAVAGPSIRTNQPMLTPAQKKEAKRAKERQYYIDAGEGIPPHLK